MNVDVTKENLAQIKQINIREYLEKEYDCHFTGTNCQCPHPDHEDHHPSFSVWTDSSGNYYWCCHSCHCGKTNLLAKNKNYGTDFIGLLRWLSDYEGTGHVLTFQEAAVKAMQYGNIPYTSTTNSRFYKEYKLKQVVADKCHDALVSDKNSAAYKYVISRGLTEEDMITWKLGFNGSRLVFPLADKSNNIVGFSNRVLDDSNADISKYINSPNDEIFNKSTYLYGMHKIDIHLDYLYITEGQFDVIAATKFGVKNVVASLGTAFNQHHIDMLKEKFPNIKKLILTFDGDLAGRKALARCAEMSRTNGYITYCCILPEGKDLFDVCMETTQTTQEQLNNFIQFYFYHETKDCVAEYMSAVFKAKCKLAEKFKTIYNKTSNTTEKHIMENYLLGDFNICLTQNANRLGNNAK